MAIVINTFAQDSSPNPTFIFSRTDGSTVDLTGATVKFLIKNPITGKHTNDSANACTVTGSNTATYAWNTAGTDLPTPGIYRAELRITYADNQQETYALTINAEARI